MILCFFSRLEFTHLTKYHKIKLRTFREEYFEKVSGGEKQGASEEGRHLAALCRVSVIYSEEALGDIFFLFPFLVHGLLFYSNNFALLPDAGMMILTRPSGRIVRSTTIRIEKSSLLQRNYSKC